MPDGTNRYDPEEIAECKGLKDDSPTGIALAKSRADQYKEIELDTIKSLVDLIKTPREKIDTLLFDIIKRLETENAELRAEAKAGRMVVALAEDTKSERETAAKILQDESAVKRQAGERIIATLAAMFGGGKAGVQLSPGQLQELILAGGFLTKEQEDQAKRIIMAGSPKVSGTAKPAETPTATTEKPPIPEAAKVVVDSIAEAIKQAGEVE